MHPANERHAAQSEAAEADEARQRWQQARLSDPDPTSAVREVQHGTEQRRRCVWAVWVVVMVAMAAVTVAVVVGPAASRGHEVEGKMVEARQVLA